MPEITIISGKGGTGKTSLTGAFFHLAENAVVCDLDVDAPDLHLILNPDRDREVDFYSGHEPRILTDACTDCGECARRCRFDAIHEGPDGLFIDPISCESCKVCVHFCPAEAILWEDRLCGQWYLSQTRFGPMVHALLFPGQENSGRLVSLLREQARELATSLGIDTIISDGPPGIGCPVISSLTGTDLVVIVTEPTPSGLHDLERVADLCNHFRIPAAVLVNKYDLNREKTAEIRSWCGQRGVEVVGEVPYDPAFVEAMMAVKMITEHQAGNTANRIRSIWARIVDLAELKQAA